MRKSVNEIMAKLNDERLDRKYDARLKHLKEAISTYRSSHFPRRTAESDREPGFAEFAHMPVFRELIMQEEPDDVVQASLLSLVDDIPNLTAAWVYRNEDEFVEKALAQLGEDFEDISEYPPAFLGLAIVTFVCTQCNRAGLRWPGILAHHCLRRSHVPNAVGGTVEKYEHAVLRHIQNDYDAPFRGQELTIFDEHVNVTRAVISACGLDITTATYCDLEGCAARFALSSSDESWTPIYDWKGVVGRNIILVYNHHSPSSTADPALVGWSPSYRPRRQLQTVGLFCTSSSHRRCERYPTRELGSIDRSDHTIFRPLQ